MNWVPLIKEEQLSEIKELSFSLPVAIFKHSTRCSISLMAKSRLESKWDLMSDELSVYYLDLLSYRSISNQIVATFGVEHASPQILIIKNGDCIYDTSHNLITVDGIKKAIKN